MVTYANGKIPLTALERLPWDEADHLYLMSAAARSLGRVAWRFELRFGKPLLITDAYRTYESQVRLRDQKGTWAAVPGTSVHGKGLAIDAASRINIENSAEHRWFVETAREFGWVWPVWASDWNAGNGQHEPWHMEYHEDLDQHRGDKDDSFPLTAGSTGRRVFLAQRQLGITVDGLAGAQFVSSIKEFQRTRGLKDDGLVGPATWAALFTEEDVMASIEDIDKALIAPLRAQIKALGISNGFRYSFDGTVWYANMSTGAFYPIPDPTFHAHLIGIEPDTIENVDQGAHDHYRALCLRAAHSITDPGSEG